MIPVRAVAMERRSVSTARRDGRGAVRVRHVGGPNAQPRVPGSSGSRASRSRSRRRRRGSGAGLCAHDVARTHHRRPALPRGPGRSSGTGTALARPAQGASRGRGESRGRSGGDQASVRCGRDDGRIELASRTPIGGRQSGAAVRRRIGRRSASPPGRGREYAAKIFREKSEVGAAHRQYRASNSNFGGRCR